MQTTNKTKPMITKYRNNRIGVLGLAALAFTVSHAPLHAADTYDASLKAGDTHNKAKEYEQALTEYDSALKLAENDGMKALAMGKKAAVYCEQKNYAAARELAEEAAAMPNLAPVAQVIVLQALGEAQLKGDKDNAAAIESLEKASRLQGVDWAQPMVNLLLGDAYSLSGKAKEGIAAYARVIALPSANQGVKAVAYLNTGTSYQYGLKDAANAKEAYAEAVKLNPELKATVDGHLAKLQ
jgi:tetratricopeptide (TPR) repeat protein